MARRIEIDPVSQAVKIANERWRHYSLQADNAADFLDHSPTDDLSGIYYYPVNWNFGEINWRMQEIRFQRTNHSFSIPASLLTGIFIDTNRPCVLLALRSVDDYFADGIKSDLPYDKFPFNDGETSFAIRYVDQ